jgi:glyoxylase-like metal-dependent hydrolase (beta-lactamase superfamily II)
VVAWPAEDSALSGAGLPGQGPLPPYLQLVLAANPGPMTLDGTNTWVVGDPRRAAPVVIDPGPDDGVHLEAIMAACAGRVAGIILTHRHPDHSELAAALAAATGCGVRAADPAFRIGPDGLDDADEIAVAGARLRVVSTPGHTSDSVSLLVRGEQDSAVRLLTGDTVLGRGTTVIAAPDGDLRSYLGSLDRLEDLVRTERVLEILPGHGPRVGDPQARLTFYRQHRRDRLEQVRAALAAGDLTPADVVARVYADVDRSLWPAAEQSVAAQLTYLRHDRG